MKIVVVSKFYLTRNLKPKTHKGKQEVIGRCTLTEEQRSLTVIHEQGVKCALAYVSKFIT